MKIRGQLRTGDWAIITGAVAIGLYERLVNDDADLISSRVAEYKVRHPILTSAVVLVTAGHLLDLIDPRFDPYHQLVRHFRSTPPPPQP